MKVLFSGCDKRFAQLCESLRDRAVQVVNIMDDVGGAVGQQKEMEYDWVILDARVLGGVDGLMNLFAKGEAVMTQAKMADDYWNGSFASCGVDISKNGTLEFSCCLQQMARGEAKETGFDGVLRSGGMVFDYQAACLEKK